MRYQPLMVYEVNVSRTSGFKWINCVVLIGAISVWLKLKLPHSCEYANNCGFKLDMRNKLSVMVA